MKSKQPNKSVSKLICNIFGHKFSVSKNVTNHVKEYTCLYCNKQLTTNSNGNLTELTPTYKEINSLLERIHKARIHKLENRNVNFTH